MTALIALALAVPLLTWALDRDMRRAEEWRRQREARRRFEESEAFRRMVRDWGLWKSDVGQRMRPAFEAMALELGRIGPVLSKLGEALKEKP